MEDKRIIPNRIKQLNKSTNIKRLSGRRHLPNEKTSINDSAKVKSLKDKQVKRKPWFSEGLYMFSEEAKKNF